MSSTPQKPASNPYNAVGLGLAMGCVMGVIALASLAIGIALDQLFNAGRLFLLICVLGGIPINMFLVLRLTQVLIKRILHPDPLRKAGLPPEQAPTVNEHDQHV